MHRMTTRRTFLERAVAVGAAAVSTTMLTPGISAPLGSDAATSAPLALERVLFDERFAAARLFAAQAQSKGATTTAINGSIHDLWYTDLYHRWREGRSPIAGITDFRSLFLLEMMAADAGMQIVHRVHHHAADGAGSHRIFGPLARRVELQDRFAIAQHDWAQCAADIVTSWPAHSALPIARRSDIADAAIQELDARTLISWIIR
jgi:hypothetical protein